MCADRDRAGRPAGLPRPRARAGRLRQRRPAPAADGCRPARARAHATFDVAARASCELQDGGRGRRGQVIDSVGRELTVPDFTHASQVSFGTPRVYPRPHDPASCRRSRPNPTRCRPPSASSAAPIACSFASTPIAPGGVTPTVTARLLNRGGTVDGRICRCSRRRAGPREIDLALSSLAAGEYLIELNAKTKRARRRS